MTRPQLRPALVYAGRMAVTLLVVVLAVVAGRRLWTHYQLEPWTRDGRVRADVVQLAPDVSGLVTRVVVVNDQPVKRGDPLFYIDRDRFELALRQAEGTVEADRATLAEARREAARDEGLGELVAREATEQSRTRVDQAQAALDQALAARDTAALNLQRTEVKAPLDGYLSDLTLRVGDYVSPGKPVIGLIDAASFRIEGYFEETKLRDLHVGQAATVRLMGETRPLKGHIASIASGIADRERTPSANLLPNVNPTFSWVRLAQRVPVRIALDHVPPDVRLIAGRTASIWIDVGPGASHR